MAMALASVQGVPTTQRVRLLQQPASSEGSCQHERSPPEGYRALHVNSARPLVGDTGVTWPPTFRMPTEEPSLVATPAALAAAALAAAGPLWRMATSSVLLFLHAAARLGFNVTVGIGVLLPPKFQSSSAV